MEDGEASRGQLRGHLDELGLADERRVGGLGVQGERGRQGSQELERLPRHRGGAYQGAPADRVLNRVLNLEEKYALRRTSNQRAAFRLRASEGASRPS